MEDTEGQGGLILVADDEPNIVELVSMYLARHGYRVATAQDGGEALRKARELKPSLLVLDVMMPGPDGLQLCRALSKPGGAPIILLTARSSDIDKIAGLRMGADDYVTKPFNPEELVARVEAVLRRGRPNGRKAAAGTMRIGRLEIDPRAHEARIDGAPIALTPRAFDLLVTLARFQGTALDREQLLDLVWGTSFYSMRTVDVHVARLREKLRGSGAQIETVWGSGYRLSGTPEGEGGP